MIKSRWERDKMRNNKAEKMSISILIFVNIFCFMIAGSTFSFSKVKSSLDKYTEDWVEVDVTIDDVAFVYDGEETERDSDGDAKTVYNFHMDRILKYTYNGVDYEVENRDTYEVSSKDFYVEPRTNYKDDKTYKVNPASPRSVSISYSMVAFDIGNMFDILDKAIAFIAILVAVVFDVIFIINKFKKKKVTFEEEQF